MRHILLAPQLGPSLPTLPKGPFELHEYRSRKESSSNRERKHLKQAPRQGQFCMKTISFSKALSVANLIPCTTLTLSTNAEKAHTKQQDPFERREAHRTTITNSTPRRQKIEVARCHGIPGCSTSQSGPVDRTCSG